MAHRTKGREEQRRFCAAEPFCCNPSAVIKKETLLQLDGMLHMAVYHGANAAELRQKELLKGECGGCSYKVICSGCRGRAYEETGDIMAADPGCWLAADG